MSWLFIAFISDIYCSKGQRILPPLTFINVRYEMFCQLTHQTVCVDFQHINCCLRYAFHSSNRLPIQSVSGAFCLKAYFPRSLYFLCFYAVLYRKSINPNRLHEVSVHIGGSSLFPINIYSCLPAGMGHCLVLTVPHFIQFRHFLFTPNDRTIGEL